MLKIILGSKSKGRKKILQHMGYDFVVMDPNIDEKAIRDNDPEKLVMLLAQAKAKALLPKIKEPALLLTADQVVRCHHAILEKPHTHEEAANFLRLYMQYPCATITAVVVTDTVTGKQESGIDIAVVYFNKIPEAMIKKIAAQKSVLHCAGGFSLDDPYLKPFIRKIEGSEDSVTGLPVKLVKMLFKKLGSDHI